MTLNKIVDDELYDWQKLAATTFLQFENSLTPDAIIITAIIVSLKTIRHTRNQDWATEWRRWAAAYIKNSPTYKSGQDGYLHDTAEGLNFIKQIIDIAWRKSQEETTNFNLEAILTAIWLIQNKSPGYLLKRLIQIISQSR